MGIAACAVASIIAANRSAALSNSSQQFSLYMGDQAIYKDSATGQSVQLPSGADHVWASTTGNTNDYILTNSGALTELEWQVDRLWPILQSAARA